MRGNIKLSNTLSAITAAIVGVVLNLAVWFGLPILSPNGNVIDWFALIVSVGAFVGRTKWNWRVIRVIIGSGLLGLLYKMIMLM
jgi:chromate transporter